MPHLQRLDIRYFALGVQGDQPGSGFRCSTTVRFGKGEDLAALIADALQAVDSPPWDEGAQRSRRATQWHWLAIDWALLRVLHRVPRRRQGRLLLGLMGAAGVWIYCHVAKGEALCWY